MNIIMNNMIFYEYDLNYNGNKLALSWESFIKKIWWLDFLILMSA